MRRFSGEVPDDHRRIPVMSSGSNRSPEQLLRKFPDDPEPVYAMRESLVGYDCVYSAHLTSYGAIPATFYPSPKTVVSISVIWLTKRQLKKMHKTEALGLNYEFGWLNDACVYLSKRGPLMIDGAPVALSAVRAERRTYKALDQQEILAKAMDILDYKNGLERFVKRSIRDPGQRGIWTAQLAKTTRPWFPEGFTDG